MENELQTPVSHRNYYSLVTCQCVVEAGWFSTLQLRFVRQPWLLLVAEGLQFYQYISHTLKIPCKNVTGDTFRRQNMPWGFFFVVFGFFCFFFTPVRCT